ncbi:MAG: S9 family peptidase [Reichenbachiella sp.]
MKKFIFTFLLFYTFVSYGQRKISVSDIYEKNVFIEETVTSLNWMNNGQFYSALEDNKIVRYNVATGESDSVLVNGDDLQLLINDYEFSSDEKRILLVTEKQSIYRRSFTAEYYVLSFKGAELQRLSSKSKQSYATFSPDNSMVAYVRENNLYYTKLVNMVEYPVTKDGKVGEIINGSSDWVYEEELMLTKAFDWSIDSKKLAYYRFDESDVKEYNLQKWDDGALYPSVYQYKYPKAGQKNSVVDIKIYDLSINKTTTIDLGEEKDFYVSQMQWTQNPNILSVVKLNRLQNRLDIFHVNAKMGMPMPIYSDKSKTYLDINNAHKIIYLKTGTHFLYSSERQGFKHFYLHRMDGQLENPITSGTWEAKDIVGLDQSSKNAILYYTSNEGSSLEQHVYKVGVNGKGKLKISKKPGINKVDMSKDFKYYISFNQSVDQPEEISLWSNKKNTLVKVLKDNAQLLEKKEKYRLRKKVFFQLEAADRKLLNCYMIQPPKMDSARRYPVLVFQYSGPGSQNVKNEWSGRHFYWHQLLAQKGYIVTVIDTRGTGGRGSDFKKETYKQLGKLEADDLIACGKQLGALNFIDEERMGIWGWSYGGYMSSLVMMKGDGLFKAGIAVAPVTTWRYYDTIYTERYLQRPQDNPLGYDNNSPNTHADHLQGEFLLIHGTGDDNVHMQNSIALQNKLIEAGKQFQSFYYPDKTHSISGEKTQSHLFQMMTNFIVKNL